MDQSKAYNRRGGYSGYVPSSNGTVVDLLAQILAELRSQNAASGAPVKEQRELLYFTGGERPVGLTHYALLTPKGRPFLSRTLCDLACYREELTLATSNWAQVTCQKCHDIGADGALALHRMSDALLISLGAAPIDTTGPSTGDEVAR